MTKERRLGRGLEALLGRLPGKEASADAATTIPFPNPNPETPAEQAAVPPARTLSLAGFAHGAEGEPPAAAAPAPAACGPADSSRVAIARIDSNPFQPRRHFDEAELQSLADSLAAHGLLQPIVVRRAGDRYQLVAGERRLRAAAKAGWADVPARVIEADDRQMAELAIVENLQRKDLGALEKAVAFQRYLEQYQSTQEELASRLKLDRSTIANLIRLLELPESVQEALRQSHITPGHARALLPLGDEREQVAFCQRIRAEGLNVRETESLVQEAISQADVEPLAVLDSDGRTTPARRVPNRQLAALEQEFRSALGLKVTLTHNRRGRGKLVIAFASHEEFEQLRDYICGNGQGDLQVG